MKADTFKKIIAAIPDNAEIFIEVKADEEWNPLKSIQISEPQFEDEITVYLNWSE